MLTVETIKLCIKLCISKGFQTMLDCITYINEEFLGLERIYLNLKCLKSYWKAGLQYKVIFCTFLFS